jgi:hypothetical protein
MNLLSELGINKEEYAEAVEQEKDFLIAPGVHTAEINKVYIRKTDLGAKMLEVEFYVGCKLLSYSNCVASGDEKGNKTTYTDKTSGKEVALPGVTSMKSFLEAAGSKDGNAEAEVGAIKHRDQNIQALIIKGLSGTSMKIAVQNYENEWNDEISERNDIIGFMDLDGKNAKGEEKEEGYAKRIAKKPLRTLKKSAAPATPKAGGSAPKGW